MRIRCQPWGFDRGRRSRESNPRRPGAPNESGRPAHPTATEVGAGRPRSKRLARDQDVTHESLTFDDNSAAVALYGDGEQTLRLIERSLGVEIHARGNEVRIRGTEAGAGLAKRVLESYTACSGRGRAYVMPTCDT